MYFPLIIIVLSLIYIIYTRIVYDRFWIQQPVFHKYNVLYYFSSPQIIQLETPTKNKYTNFTDIETSCFNQLEDPLWNKFLSMIQNKTGDTNEKLTILPIFNSVLERSYISFYNEPVVFQNVEKGYYIDEKRPVGVITSRPLRMFIKQSDVTTTTEIPVYYIDFLHVDNNKTKQEKKNITYELIQTHIYNQQLLNAHALKNGKSQSSDRNIRICLFKRYNIRNNNIGVVPLCLYKSHVFSLKQYYFKKTIYECITQSQNHFKHYQVFEITKSTFHNVLDFIKEQHIDRFRVFILPNINNLFEQITSRNLIVYYLFDVINGNIISVYFFRINKKTITSVASICYYDEMEKRSTGIVNKNTQELFIYGFKTTVTKLTEKKVLNAPSGNSKREKSSEKEEEYEYFCIENISDNCIIVDDLIKSSENKSYLFYRTRDTMYFLYNYIHKQCDSKHVFILQ